MSTSITAVLEFKSSGTAFVITGLSTEVAANIVSFLTITDDPLLAVDAPVFLSGGGLLHYVLEYITPSGRGQTGRCSQVNVII